MKNNSQCPTENFNREQLVNALRKKIDSCDFMRVYQYLGGEVMGEKVTTILVVAPDRDLAGVASYLVDGINGVDAFRQLHAKGDLLGEYEAWGDKYATFDLEPGDRVRVLFTPPAFIVQRIN